MRNFVMFCLFSSIFMFTFYSNKVQGNENSIDAEKKLKELGVKLQEPRPFKANFVRTVRTGNLVFLSGHIPVNGEGKLVKGKVGSELSVDDGKAAARWSAIGLLSSLKGEIGSLNKVKKIVKVTGMVNATDDFTKHSVVINGCSDLLVDIFGEAKGKHARAAVGMSSLPLGVAVEIEMIVEVSE